MSPDFDTERSTRRINLLVSVISTVSLLVSVHTYFISRANKYAIDTAQASFSSAIALRQGHVTLSSRYEAIACRADRESVWWRNHAPLVLIGLFDSKQVRYCPHRLTASNE